MSHARVLARGRKKQIPCHVSKRFGTFLIDILIVIHHKTPYKSIVNTIDNAITFAILNTYL